MTRRPVDAPDGPVRLARFGGLVEGRSDADNRARGLPAPRPSKPIDGMGSQGLPSSLSDPGQGGVQQQEPAMLDVRPVTPPRPCLYCEAIPVDPSQHYSLHRDRIAAALVYQRHLERGASQEAARAAANARLYEATERRVGRYERANTRRRVLDAVS